MNWTFNFLHCPSQSGGGSNCVGIASVYRMSFTLLLFYSLIFFFCLFRNKLSKLVNEGLWAFKVLCIITAFISFFFIPNEFFVGKFINQ
jgi:hypothetical protein